VYRPIAGRRKTTVRQKWTLESLDFKEVRRSKFEVRS